MLLLRKIIFMISVIIAVYKRLDILHLILQALSRQSYANFEAIIAEDDNAVETVEFIQCAREKYSYSIKHVSHEDLGARKTAILNKALRAAEGEQLVFLDGDCIPQRHLLSEYSKAIQGNVMCYGRRVYLSKSISEKLLTVRSIDGLNIWKAIAHRSKSIIHGFYMPWKKNIHKQNRSIKGCNWGVERAALISINGYDEDYQCLCVGEDDDIDWRLKKKGYKMLSMKNKAIVFHIYHPINANYNRDESLNMMHEIMSRKIREGNVYCLNGLEKLK